jgi:hypothetical protein
MTTVLISAGIGTVTAWAYPSDDLTMYQAGSLLSSYQQALGDLHPAQGGEPPYPGIGTTRYTQWQGEIGGNPLTIHIMCSETDPHWIAGPGTVVTVGGVDWTLTKCVGEKRIP